MPKKRDMPELARRERQIMDVIFKLGEATVGEVLERLPDPPSYSSVRTIIRKIEAKGLLTHRQDGKRYVYRARQSRETASRTALQKLMDVCSLPTGSIQLAILADGYVFFQRFQIFEIPDSLCIFAPHPMVSF